MAAAITERELEVAAILQSLSDFFHDAEDPLPCSRINSIRWGATKRRSAVTSPEARCKAPRQIDSPSPPPHFRNSPSPPPAVTFEPPPALAQIDVGEKKTGGLVAAELEEAVAGTGSPVSPLYFDQIQECADHRRKAPSPSIVRPLKKSKVQHKDWVRTQTNEISRLREEKRVLTQRAEAARIRHEVLLAENSRLKALKSRSSNKQRKNPQPPPPPPPQRIETISFPIERKPSPLPTPEPEVRTDFNISSALFANYARQRVEIPGKLVEIPDLNCYEELVLAPSRQPLREPTHHQWVAPPLERHLYRLEGSTPEEKRAATAAARRRRVEIKRRKAAAAAVAVTAVPAPV